RLAQRGPLRAARLRPLQRLRQAQVAQRPPPPRQVLERRRLGRELAEDGEQLLAALEQLPRAPPAAGGLPVHPVRQLREPHLVGALLAARAPPAVPHGRQLGTA